MSPTKPLTQTKMLLHDVFIESPNHLPRTAVRFTFPIYEELIAIESKPQARSPLVVTPQEALNFSLMETPPKWFDNPLILSTEGRYYKNPHNPFWKGDRRFECFIEFGSGSEWFTFLQDHVTNPAPSELTISCPYSLEKLPTLDLLCQTSGVGFGVQPYLITCHLINFGVRYGKHLPVTFTKVSL